MAIPVYLFIHLEYHTALVLRQWVRSRKMPTHTHWKCGQSLKSLIYAEGPVLNCMTKLCQWLKNSSWVLPCLTDTLTHSQTHSASKQKTTSTISQRTGLINWGGGPLACLFLSLCVWLETHNSLCYLVMTFLSPLRNPPVGFVLCEVLSSALWDMSLMAFCGNVAHEIRFHACMDCW